MDVVGSMGYVGQEIYFMDVERFAYRTGNSICIYDTTKGPREMIWRMDNGISCITTNTSSQILIVASMKPNNSLEVLNIADQMRRIDLENPVSTPVIYLCCSREGDKIFGISGTTNHQILVWSAGTNSRLLLSKKLDLNCKYCSNNPCGSNYVCLYGDDGIIIGIMNEILGNYTIQLTTIELDNGEILEQSKDEKDSAEKACINFAIWLPFNRLLVGNGCGSIFEIRCETKKARYLGKFILPEKQKSTIVKPTQAVLSVNSIIVGTASGTVYWFPVLNLMTLSEQENIIGFDNPLQVCSLSDAISCLTVDQNYLTLLVGTHGGDIYKLPLELSASTMDSQIGNGDDPNRAAATDADLLLDSSIDAGLTASQFRPIDSVTAELMGSDSKSGITLCADHLTIDVLKFSTRSKSSLSMFATGSHSGCLRFWRHTSQAVEAMVIGGGIRRSTPRALKSLFQLTLSATPHVASASTSSTVGSGSTSVGQTRGKNLAATANVADTPPPAICALEFVSLPIKHAKLICIGTDDGHFEAWSMEAVENEDEDAKESTSISLTNNGADGQQGNTGAIGDNSYRLVEDDEGGCLVRLEVHKLFHSRVFVTPVSMMTSFSVSIHSVEYIKLAIASDVDHRIYIMSILKGGQLVVQNGIEHVFPLESQQLPRSLIWHDSVLNVFCESGMLTVIDIKEPDTGGTRSSHSNNNYANSRRMIHTGLHEPVVIIDGSLSPNIFHAVVLTNTLNMYTFPLKALLARGASDDTFSSNADNSADISSLDRSGGILKRFQHSDVAVKTAHAPSGRYFATGCIDGSLSIWKVDTEEESIHLANKVSLHSGPVAVLAFSTDSSLLLSCGVDGSCFILTLDKPAPRGFHRAASIRASFMQDDDPQYLSELLPEKSLVSAAQKSAAAASAGLTWAEQRETEKAKELRSRHKFKTMGITAAIGEISQRLKVMVAQNAERNSLEILDRSEFVIDITKKETIEKSNREKVAETHNLYRQRNHCNDLRAARIRSKCWDQLEVKVLALLPLSPQSSIGDNASAGGDKVSPVTSFSILRYTVSQQATLNKVKRLRAVEVMSQRAEEYGSVCRISGTPYYRSAWTTAVTGCPQSVSWISNDGTRWPISDKIAHLLANEKIIESGGKDKDTAAGKANPSTTTTAVGTTASNTTQSGEGDDDDASTNSNDEEREIDTQNILNLLYPPQAVRTQVQKRTQMLLLKEIVRQIRMKFNDQFNHLRKEKEDCIASIESRNVRIKAILTELRQNSDDVFSPTMMDREIAGSAILVQPDELTNRPYESEAVKQQRLREEEERRRKEAEKDKEDAKGRALEEMMHGTLEVKRDVFAEVASACVKADWMDTLLPNEMNEAQLKEYEIYQAKLKVLQEEQTNYRKSLEQEMKKLRNEVTDLCKAFDEKLGELSGLKVLVHREILSHEIYISRLALNMTKTEQTWKFLKKSEEQVQSLRADRAELRFSIDQLSTQLEDMKGKINAIQEEEKQMDKTFRRDLQNLCNTTFDQDALKIFTQLYRRRTYPRGGNEASAEEEYGEQSEVDASASVSRKHRRSKDGSATRGGGKSSGTRSHSKKAGGGALGGSSTTNTDGGGRNAGRNKMKASAKGGGVSASAGGNASLGPMQQAAQALRSSEETVNYKEKDPYYEALLEEEKQKLIQESQVPILSQLSIELDCPEGFDIDQFAWSKLQELRNTRIEKEIEGKMLSIDFSKLKQKLERLDGEEVLLASCISDIKASRDAAVAALNDLDANLDIVVRLRQGQDEVDKDAVVTDYSDSLLLPVDVLTKYNTRIKELGKEKIGVLSKIKQFRRKINLIDWEAKHHGLEARHFEAYLTDLQLFRVTRELQKIIREGNDAALNKEKIDRVNQRKDFLAQDAEVKLVSLKRNNDSLQRQLEERNQECLALEDTIANLKAQVSLSKSVKSSRDEARGGMGNAMSVAAAKMKKVVSRRHMVDTARAQAEEIDYLRQELDKMRQRTFPSFVRATKNRLPVNIENKGI